MAVFTEGAWGKVEVRPTLPCLFRWWRGKSSSWQWQSGIVDEQHRAKQRAPFCQ